MRWGVFKQKLISLRIIYFVHVLLDCNLFEINISYGFRNINLLCQQPLAQLIITLTMLHNKTMHCHSSRVEPKWIRQFARPPPFLPGTKSVFGNKTVCIYSFTSQIVM